MARDGAAKILAALMMIRHRRFGMRRLVDAMSVTVCIAADYGDDVIARASARHLARTGRSPNGQCQGNNQEQSIPQGRKHKCPNHHSSNPLAVPSPVADLR
jgi:hypothetical protein